VLEAVEQLDGGGVLPVEIRLDAVEVGHAGKNDRRSVTGPMHEE
jgi:hypothetical protein